MLPVVIIHHIYIDILIDCGLFNDSTFDTASYCLLLASC